MSGMWYCYTLTAFFFINFSTCGTLNKILFYMFGVIVLLVFHETDPTFWCFLLIFKVRSKRGLLNTWQRIKADFIALSYCADGSALQLHYYNLLIACSACVFSNRPEAESGARSSFRYIWDSANPLLVIFFFSLFPYRIQNTSNHQHLLHGHLRHHIKCSEVRIGKAVFILAHLDGIQPLIHSAEAGEVWDAAVQEREMNSEGDTSRAR